MNSKPTIIYNQDSTNLFMTTRVPIRPFHVEKMVKEVADAGVDIMLICPNAQKTNYPSKVWQSDWDDYKEGDKSYSRNANGEYDKTNQFYSAEFAIPEKYIKDGENKFILRNEGIEISVCGIEVGVK